MSSFLAYTVNGLVLGSTYALTAIGYSMVYGILELVNFTHSCSIFWFPSPSCRSGWASC